MQKDDSFLNEEINSLKKEVEQVRDKSIKFDKPWYQMPSVLVSVFSLFFAVVTASLSYLQTERVDRREQRAELRELLREFNTLTAQLAQIEKDRSQALSVNSQNLTEEQKNAYRVQEVYYNNLSNTVHDERNSIARQTHSLGEQSKAFLSGEELYSIAIALEKAYDTQGSLKFSQWAAEASDQPWRQIMAMLQSARMQFYLDPIKGRTSFQQAKQFIESDTTMNEINVKDQLIRLFGQWADVEMYFRFCNESNELINQGDRVINSLAIVDQQMERLISWFSGVKDNLAYCSS